MSSPSSGINRDSTSSGGNRGRGKPSGPLRSQMTRAERRALQERQRAEKQQQRQQQQQQSSKNKKQHQQQSSNNNNRKQGSRGGQGRSSSSSVQGLFAHLQQQQQQQQHTTEQQQQQHVMHPAMTRLAVQYAAADTEGHGIRGSGARAVGLVEALRSVVRDYEGPPADRRATHDLDSRVLTPLVDHVKQRGRPLSVGMGNALKHFKLRLHHAPQHEQQHVDGLRQTLLDDLERFVEERVAISGAQIVRQGVQRIVDGDVVVVFARSRTVQQVLLEAHRRGTKFSVVVVANARPVPREGRALLRTLAAHGVPCTYTLLSGAAHMMKDATKVLLGAHAMLANGALMGRVGTACLAMLAHRHNVPVLVCCATYKFSERSQIDAITRNEVADPQELLCRPAGTAASAAATEGGHQPQQQQHRPAAYTSATALNLMYDITPSHFIDMIITEVGQLPPTSVIHILREYGNPLSAE